MVRSKQGLETLATLILMHLMSLTCAFGDVLLNCDEERIGGFNLEPVNIDRLTSPGKELTIPGFVWISPKPLGKVALEELVQSCFAMIYIVGEIKSGDADIVKKLLEIRASQGLGSLDLDLNSAGGEMYEAMTIGRLLPEMGAIVSVDEGAFCASACVLVFAGGARKMILGTGKLAIHRIEFSQHNVAATLKHDDYRKLYEKGMDEVRTYLKEMGVRIELVDEMMRYSSDEAHVLTDEEIGYYGLDQQNPYLYEMEKSKWIARCGKEWWELKKILEKTADENCPYDNFWQQSNDGIKHFQKEKYAACRAPILDPLYRMCLQSSKN